MKIFIAATLSLMALNVNASTVTYDESINGDLVWGGTYGDYMHLGELGAGTNTISGDGGFNPNTGWDDFDGFRFDVASNMQIISARLTFNVTGGLTAGWHFLDMTNNDLSDRPFVDSPTTLLTDVFTQSDTTFDIFTDGTMQITSPIQSGNYIMSAGSFSAPSGTEGGFISYTFEFDVAPVPIPATVWLFGSGLIGLIGVARRKVRT